MRCERAQELFSDYCEGSIQAAFAVPLESHLSGCPTCRHEVDSLRQLWHMLDEVPLVEAPSGFRAHVLDRLEDNQSSLARKRSFDWKSLFTRKSLAWSSAALLVLLLGTVVVPGRYTTAWLGSFGDLFHRTQPALKVAVTDVQMPASVASDEITVKLTVSGSGDADAIVKVLSGGAVLMDDSRTVTLSAGKPAEIHLKRLGPPTGEQIRLELNWKDGGNPRTETVTLK